MRRVLSVVFVVLLASVGAAADADSLQTGNATRASAAHRVDASAPSGRPISATVSAAADRLSRDFRGGAARDAAYSVALTPRGFELELRSSGSDAGHVEAPTSVGFELHELNARASDLRSAPWSTKHEPWPRRSETETPLRPSTRSTLPRPDLIAAAPRELIERGIERPTVEKVVTHDFARQAAGV